MQNLFEDLKKLLSQDNRFMVEGSLLKNKIVELALQVDAGLMKILLSNESMKKHFFQEVDGVFVFDKIKFQKFVSNKSFLPDSYTSFKNKIGLTTDDDFISESKEVVLSWPYKDCVLEGGQTKEDAKRSEVFWNETLAPDQIDRLLSPKALTNFKKFDKDGEHKVTSISKSDNLIIKGNNLLALQSIKKVYANQVKLIYIDPPYNTGNDSFKYNDSFNHSTWLTFMRNRLSVAKELLSPEGTLAISIDHNETIYTQLLCDEIFGKNNRKNIVTVKRSSVSGAKVINPGVVNVSDYLLIYCKNPAAWSPNRVYRKKDRDDRYNSYITNINSDPTSWEFSSVLDAFALSIGLEKKKLKKYFGDEYEAKLEEFYYSNAERIFRFAALDDKSVSDDVVNLKYKSKEDNSKVYILEREGRLNYYIYNGQAMLFFKDRLLEIDGEKVFAELITDIWDDVLPNDLHNEGGVTLKKGKKPEKLIQRIIQLTTNENDLILDYHLGSGTTAAVAHKMNRKYLGLEQLDYGEHDSVIRLKNVIEGESSGISKSVEWKGGGSFVYCELAKANQKFIEQITSAKDNKELKSLWGTMQEKAFLGFNVNPKSIDENAKEFEQLSFDDQQRFLIDVLDKNMLYIPYSEITDETYGISKEEIELNKKFYSQK